MRRRLCISLLSRSSTKRYNAGDLRLAKSRFIALLRRDSAAAADSLTPSHAGDSRDPAGPSLPNPPRPTPLVFNDHPFTFDGAVDFRRRTAQCTERSHTLVLCDSKQTLFHAEVSGPFHGIAPQFERHTRRTNDFRVMPMAVSVYEVG